MSNSEKNQRRNYRNKVEKSLDVASQQKIEKPVNRKKVKEARRQTIYQPHIVKKHLPTFEEQQAQYLQRKKERFATIENTKQE